MSRTWARVVERVFGSLVCLALAYLGVRTFSHVVRDLAETRVGWSVFWRVPVIVVIGYVAVIVIYYTVGLFVPSRKEIAAGARKPVWAPWWLVGLYDARFELRSSSWLLRIYRWHYLQRHPGRSLPQMVNLCVLVFTPFAAASRWFFVGNRRYVGQQVASPCLIFLLVSMAGILLLLYGSAWYNRPWLTLWLSLIIVAVAAIGGALLVWQERYPDHPLFLRLERLGTKLVTAVAMLALPFILAYAGLTSQRSKRFWVWFFTARTAWIITPYSVAFALFTVLLGIGAGRDAVLRMAIGIGIIASIVGVILGAVVLMSFLEDRSKRRRLDAGDQLAVGPREPTLWDMGRDYVKAKKQRQCPMMVLPTE